MTYHHGNRKMIKQDKSNTKAQKRIIFPLLVILLWLTGCASVPFKETPLTPLPEELSPEKTRQEFKDRLPNRFTSEETLIFSFLWRELAVLGYSNIDRREETFEVMALNHLGIQLFYITGDRANVKLQYAIPEFAEQPELIDAIGNDIRRVYFNMIPDSEAEPTIYHNRLVFSQKMNGGTLQHVFGGKKLNLIEKKFRRGLSRKWEVKYYEYAPLDNFNFPRGIILRNRDHGYRLIIKIRDISSMTGESDKSG